MIHKRQDRGAIEQQTLDYLQSLYEKKLCTYPRTDSRYLTGDMADSLPVLVNLVASAMPFRKGIAITCDPHTVINDKKVTDHHAVIPTRNLKDADLSALPAGEKAVLELVALRLMLSLIHICEYAHSVGGSGESHQNGKAKDYRPGPQQDRGSAPR